MGIDLRPGEAPSEAHRAREESKASRGRVPQAPSCHRLKLGQSAGDVLQVGPMAFSQVGNPFPALLGTVREIRLVLAFGLLGAKMECGGAYDEPGEKLGLGGLLGGVWGHGVASLGTVN